MSTDLVLAFVLGAAALVAMARYLASRRTHGAMRLALVALQAPIAALLWLALADGPAPPHGPLVVLTAGAEIPAAAPPERTIALPEAPADTRFERVPDLATALRRNPGAGELHILGDGLAARDRDAARTLPVRYAAPPETAGLAELAWPARVAPGRNFTITGRAVVEAGERIELRDPGDRVVTTATPGSDGRFALAATAGPAGPARWRVRLVGGDDGELDAADVTIHAVAPPALRIGIAAGGASPELKHLRRALSDAGHALATRLALGGGVEITDAPLALDAAALATLDVLVLDERAWRAIGAAPRAAIDSAVRDGLGLLLRATGPLDESVRRDWRLFGLAIEPDADARTTLAFEGERERPPGLTALPWRVVGPGTSPLRLAGREIGAWRPLGLGRVAFWHLADSHRLVTSGHAARHGELWASTLETLARAGGTRVPHLVGKARVGERVAICGLDAPHTAIAPDGTRTALVRDAAADACAGYWPIAAGTHRLEPAGSIDGAAAVFEVEPHDATSPRARAALAAATQALARASGSTQAPRAGPRWIALVVAFALLALCWLLERRALRAAAPRDAAA